MKYQLPPLSIYIHFPWCVKKCPYCDFNSHEMHDFDESAYIEALIQDLQLELPFVQGRSIESIFMGGGTPSLFSAQHLKNILKAIQECIPCSSQIEITLEANPGTVDSERFKSYFEIGINRLSIGIQSFDDDKLKRLGRIHSKAHAMKAIEGAYQAGFENINLDIMHGLPRQTPEESLNDLKIATGFKPKHISWYQLTLEPNTPFAKYPPKLPNEDLLESIENEGFAWLAAEGYERYEISAFSKSGFASKHNLNYWQFGDYLAIGAGAHGKVTINNIITRRVKKKMPKNYLKASPHFLKDVYTIQGRDRLFEFFLNRLRLLKPITYEEIRYLTGYEKSAYRSTLVQLEAQSLLVLSAQSFNLTSKGIRFLNNVTTAFLESTDQNEID